MNDTNKPNDNSNQAEKPQTVKPVKGTFKQNKKKLGQMLKNARTTKPRKGTK
jgi:hypothetical protein